MEKIYPPSHFECTEKLSNVQQYFDSYLQLSNFLDEDEMFMSDQDLIIEKFNSFGLESAPTLEPESMLDMCSVNDLTVPGELPQLEVFVSNKYTMKLLHKEDKLPKEANQLETIRAKLEFNNAFLRKKELQNIFLKPEKSDNADLSLQNYLVLVRVYQPFNSLLKRNLNRRFEKLKCSHEIVAVASNKLSELRDKILCVHDTGFSFEINDLKNIGSHNVKEEYPSGLIGIDDMLYTDMRHKNAVDYSEVIKEWSKKKNVADFKVFPMDKICLSDLNFRMGYPYVYQHRGNCEHILIFADMRLIKRSDSLCSSDYPFYRNINRYNIEQCNICRLSPAKWICCDSDRLPYDRAFLCEECFLSYNYIGGEKIGNFKAYPYYHRSLVI